MVAPLPYLPAPALVLGLAAAAEDTSCLMPWRSGCDSITDELLCLTSRDGRDITDSAGLLIRDEPCVWCGTIPCTSNNDNRCEPRDWLLRGEGTAFAKLIAKNSYRQASCSASACADGTEDVVFVPGKVVGCSAEWAADGLAAGQAACSSGFHICADQEEVSRLGLSAATCRDRPLDGDFYASRASSAGDWDCEGSSGTNDIWGCGKDGHGVRYEDRRCGVLNKAIGNLDFGSWTNMYRGTDELLHVRKGLGHGGVLCCKKDLRYCGWASAPGARIGLNCGLDSPNGNGCSSSRCIDLAQCVMECNACGGCIGFDFIFTESAYRCWMRAGLSYNALGFQNVTPDLGSWQMYVNEREDMCQTNGLAALQGHWDITYTDGSTCIYRVSSSGLVYGDPSSSPRQVIVAGSPADAMQDLSYSGLFLLPDANADAWEYFWLVHGQLHIHKFNRHTCKLESPLTSPHFCGSGIGKLVNNLAKPGIPLSGAAAVGDQTSNGCESIVDAKGGSCSVTPSLPIAGDILQPLAMLMSHQWTWVPAGCSHGSLADASELTCAGSFNSIWPAHMLGRPLIFDVGLYNGRDTLEYLRAGHRVLAVEANPLMYHQAAMVLSPFIRSGQLRIIHGALHEDPLVRPGIKVPFYISKVNEDWSNLERAIGCRKSHAEINVTDVSRCEQVDVPTINCGALLREFGVPYYLKIDVDFHELACLRELKFLAVGTQRLQHLPYFVSFERNVRTESYLQALSHMGYSRVKMVDQSLFGDWSGPFGDLAFDTELGHKWHELHGYNPPTCELWCDFHLALGVSRTSGTEDAYNWDFARITRESFELSKSMGLAG